MSTLATLTSVAVLAAEETTLPAGAIPPVAFLVTGLFALVVFFLGMNLVRRIRRNHFRAEIRDALAVEIAERDQSAGAAAGATDGVVGPEPSKGDTSA